MTQITSVMKRELLSLFGQPLASVALSIFVMTLAVFSLWMGGLLEAGVASMNQPFFWIATCLSLFIPALTMRLVAEERRQGTLEVLCTLPLSSTQIVLGKWLAAWLLALFALLLTMSYPIAMSQLGSLDWGPVVGGYLGLALMAGAFCAIGVAASSMTDNQVLAFLSAAVVCVFPWILGFALTLFPGQWVHFVQALTFEVHFSNLAQGVLDSRSLVYYASIILIALRLAVLSFEVRRLSS